MRVNEGVKLKLGEYFIVTSGYCENGGMVSKEREALLFLAEGENLFRQASNDEVKSYQNMHPVLKSGR